MWIRAAKNPHRMDSSPPNATGICPPGRENLVNTHSGDNPVSINQVFNRAVACVLPCSRGRLLYWMNDNAD